MTLFLMNQTNVKNLHEKLPVQFLSDLKVKEYQSLALTHFRIFSKIFYYFTGTIFMTAVMIGVLGPGSALIHGVYAIQGPAQYPYINITEGGIFYYVIIIEDSVAGFMQLAISSGIHSLFGHYTMLICGELRILGYLFDNLKKSDNYKASLRECVDRYNFLIDCKNMLQKIYGMKAIWLAITSAIVVCTNIFEGTQVRIVISFD